MRFVLDDFKLKILSYAVWLGLAIGMCTVVLLDQKERSVTPSYRKAAINWFESKPLYNMKGSDFIYFPQAALAFAPWGFLPRPVGEVFWRCSILTIFALGVRRLTSSCGGNESWQLITTISAALIGAGCVRNGQSTLMIAGLMMLATVDASEKKWWRSSLLISLAFAFKPLALVLLLLLAGTYLPMLWRIAICMIFVALAPFLTQSPDYVISQFRDCFENSRIAFDLGESGHWAQFFGMLKVFGLDCDSKLQQFVRLTTAILTWITCRWVIRKLPSQRSAVSLYGLAACYIMLFNSRTEGSTYAMVGAVYGILFSIEMYESKRIFPAILYALAIISTIFNFDLALLFVKRPNEVWLAPFICTIVTCDLTYRIFTEFRVSKAEEATRESASSDERSH